MKPALNHLQEAAALMKLANNNALSGGRETLIAATGWEIARFAYLNDKLPSVCRKVVLGELPSLSMALCAWDEIFRHSDFPQKKWSELAKQEKQLLIRLLVGDQTRGARLLKGQEAKRHAFWFTVQPSPPDFQPMDDGSVVVMLRVYPGIGERQTTRDMIDQLKQLPSWKSYGRSNSNDVRRHEQCLKGLAALWLKAGDFIESERNKTVFKNRGAKGDYALLRKVTKTAKDEVDTMVRNIEKRGAASDVLEQTGQPLQEALEVCINKTKRRRK